MVESQGVVKYCTDSNPHEREGRPLGKVESVDVVETKASDGLRIH